MLIPIKNNKQLTGKEMNKPHWRKKRFSYCCHQSTQLSEHSCARTVSRLCKLSQSCVAIATYPQQTNKRTKKRQSNSAESVIARRWWDGMKKSNTKTCTYSWFYTRRFFCFSLPARYEKCHEFSLLCDANKRTTKPMEKSAWIELQMWFASP